MTTNALLRWRMRLQIKRFYRGLKMVCQTCRCPITEDTGYADYNGTTYCLACDQAEAFDPLLEDEGEAFIGEELAE